MDIQTLARTVIRTFEDAANLVKRIQQKRDASDAPALPEEPTNELLNSLDLGPVIIRGHYDHDLKRFGEPYACGDIQAREQMKDVLISLQIALITGLNRVWMDDGEIDYNEMQSVSDDSRVNAGVCLGQLSQRLSDAAKAQSMYSSQNGMYPPGSMLKASPPALQYSSSRSTNSSGFSRAQTMTTSNVMEDFGNMKLQAPHLTRPPLRDRNASLSSSSSLEQRWTSAAQRPVPTPLFVRDRHSSLSADSLSMRRPSSHCLAPEDSQLLSPSALGKSPQASPRQRSVEPTQEAYTSPHSGSQEASPQLSRTSSTNQSSSGVVARGPDAMSGRAPSRMTANDYPSYTTHWEARQARSQPIHQSYRGITSNGQDYSTMEHVKYLQKTARPPIPDTSRIRSDSRTQFKETQYDAQNPPPHGVQRMQHQTDQQSQQMPIEYYSRPSISGPIPVESQHAPQNHTPRQIPQTRPSISSLSPSNTQISRSMSMTSSLTAPLTLPTDKNTLGFCKGAFRMFIGLEKKAFSINNRPIGISGVIPYWKCEKCSFEGPCIINVLPGQKRSKAERTYDLKVRECSGGGVLYRWAFLAKCHVMIKSTAELNTPEQRRGEYGSFGCIFCASEAQRRGWALSGNDIYTGADEAKKGKKHAADAVSVNSGAGGGTPIFGNVGSFMDHLQVHRREEFDIALLPL